MEQHILADLHAQDKTLTAVLALLVQLSDKVDMVSDKVDAIGATVEEHRPLLDIARRWLDSPAARWRLGRHRQETTHGGNRDQRGGAAASGTGWPGPA